MFPRTNASKCLLLAGVLLGLWLGASQGRTIFKRTIDYPLYREETIVGTGKSVHSMASVQKYFTQTFKTFSGFLLMKLTFTDYDEFFPCNNGVHSSSPFDVTDVQCGELALDGIRPESYDSRLNYTRQAVTSVRVKNDILKTREFVIRRAPLDSGLVERVIKAESNRLNFTAREDNNLTKVGCRFQADRTLPFSFGGITGNAFVACASNVHRPDIELPESLAWIADFCHTESFVVIFRDIRLTIPSFEVLANLTIAREESHDVGHSMRLHPVRVEHSMRHAGDESYFKYYGSIKFVEENSTMIIHIDSSSTILEFLNLKLDQTFNMREGIIREKGLLLHPYLQMLVSSNYNLLLGQFRKNFKFFTDFFYDWTQDQTKSHEPDVDIDFGFDPAKWFAKLNVMKERFQLDSPETPAQARPEL